MPVYKFPGTIARLSSGLCVSGSHWLQLLAAQHYEPRSVDSRGVVQVHGPPQESPLAGSGECVMTCLFL